MCRQGPRSLPTADQPSAPGGSTGSCTKSTSAKSRSARFPVQCSGSAAGRGTRYPCGPGTGRRPPFVRCRARGCERRTPDSCPSRSPAPPAWGAGCRPDPQELPKRPGTIPAPFTVEFADRSLHLALDREYAATPRCHVMPRRTTSPAPRRAHWTTNWTGALRFPRPSPRRRPPTAL